MNNISIVLGKKAGFCYGVKRVINKMNTVIDDNKEIFCLGEIVHNKNVINDFEKKGVKFVNNIEEIKEKVIIRAHGEKKETIEKLKDNGIEIIDLTCPNVLNTHKIAEEYQKNNYFIVLIGIKNHPESIATLSYCGEKSFLLQEKEDVKFLMDEIEKCKADNVLIMAQTTYNSKKFDEISKLIKEKLKNINVEIKKTICNATEERQKETKEIACDSDAMLIIGDKKSSNTNKLYDIANENCTKTYFIQDENEFTHEMIKNCPKIGIMAGASTPKNDIDSVIEKIKKYGGSLNDR